jgi:hypothetical protein
MRFANSTSQPLRAFVAMAGLAAAGIVHAAPVPQFDHVVIVVEENHDFGNIIGNVDAPYMNSLAAAGANFTQSYAIEHPSQPNYLDLFSGSNQGVTDDSCPHTFSAANLGGALIAAGLSFAGYSEDLPAADPTACSSGAYKRKHSPWINFSNVPAASNQPLTAFPDDFTELPTLSFVIPNQCHDMHGQTGCTSNLVAIADTWLHDHLDAYVQWAPTHNSLLILTWDENDGSVPNQIATVFTGALVVPGDYDERIDHFSVLSTLEAMYGLPYTGSTHADAVITDVWDTRFFSDGFEP